MIDQLRQEVNELISDETTWIGAFKYEWDDAITCSPIVKKDYVGTLEDTDDDVEFRQVKAAFKEVQKMALEIGLILDPQVQLKSVWKQFYGDDIKELEIQVTNFVEKMVNYSTQKIAMDKDPITKAINDRIDNNQIAVVKAINILSDRMNILASMTIKNQEMNIKTVTSVQEFLVNFQIEQDKRSADQDSKLSLILENMAKLKSEGAPSAKRSVQESVIEDEDDDESIIEPVGRTMSMGTMATSTGGAIVLNSAKLTYLDPYNDGPSKASIWLDVLGSMFSHQIWDKKQLKNKMRAYGSLSLKNWITNADSSVFSSWAKFEDAFRKSFINKKIGPLLVAYTTCYQKKDQSDLEAWVNYEAKGKLSGSKMKELDHVKHFGENILKYPTTDVKRRIEHGEYTTISQVEYYLNDQFQSNRLKSPITVPRPILVAPKPGIPPTARAQVHFNTQNLDQHEEFTISEDKFDYVQYEEDISASILAANGEIPACVECNRKHFGACWAKTLCTLCEKYGHPADRCQRRCQICNDLKLKPHLKNWTDNCPGKARVNELLESKNE